MTHSLKETCPSLFVSKSMSKSEGAQRRSPGFLSPLKYPSLTRCDSEGGKTGITARIRSIGLMSNSPSGARNDAKYSKTFKKNQMARKYIKYNKLLNYLTLLLSNY